MKHIQKVIVSIDFGNNEMQVGELIKEGKGIYFKYYTEFINTRLEISPFHLPLKNTIFTAPAQPFEGLFGVFSDSLPDGWGHFLLDRTLTSKGILLQDVTPLQRLSYVGLNGMGALIYRPQIETIAHEKLQIGLSFHKQDQFDQAQKIYTGILEKNPNHFDALQLSETA